MIDPFTALAAVKSAVSAGKELVNVTKQIGEFFDGVDDLRAAHEKKKNSLFSGSDENAMETFVNLQRAKDAEEELRQIVIATRGFSAWGELQAIRVQARKDRKAKIEAERKRKAKLIEKDKPLVAQRLAVARERKAQYEARKSAEEEEKAAMAEKKELAKERGNKQADGVIADREAARIRRLLASSQYALELDV